MNMKRSCEKIVVSECFSSSGTKFLFLHHHNKICTHNILFGFFCFYLLHVLITSSHNIHCLIGLRNKQGKYSGRAICFHLT